MGPFDFCTTPRSGANPAFAESALAAAAAASLAGLVQPARNAPADAARTVRPKLRLVYRPGEELLVSERFVLHELHPPEMQLPQ